MRKKKTTPKNTPKPATNQKMAKRKAPIPKAKPKVKPQPQPEPEIVSNGAAADWEAAVNALGGQAAALINQRGLLGAIQVCDALAFRLGPFCPLEAYCSECRVAMTGYHEPGCRREQCPYCGLLRGEGCCDDADEFGDIPADDRIPYSGHHPYFMACCELGWFDTCENDDDSVPCDMSHPDAIADTSRLIRQAHWDRAAKRWVAGAADAAVSDDS